MKVKSIGRYLLIKVDHDIVQNKSAGGIALPDEFIDRQKGGCQLSTILSVGDCAFDEHDPRVRDEIVPGTQIITARYPGHEVDLDPQSRDDDATKLRVIADDEVRCIVADNGVEVAA